ncbi:MAG: hypothetical protein Q7U88_14460 [Desulfocapsaceae bacterium]|nr:hypothetical protein [Desulfocapsaceae bacterium]
MNLLHTHESENELDREAEASLFARRIRTLSSQPFGAGDTSTGMEYELQVAVEGDQQTVDLPLSIRGSSFFSNTVKRVGQGDLPPWRIDSLRNFLDHNETGVWENSWIRFKEDRLSDYARKMLHHDLLADKGQPEGPKRSDLHRFFFTEKGEAWLRLPVSYLLKLALADVIGSAVLISPVIYKTGKDLFSHFLSDNTSPEILSFTIPVAGKGQVGRLAARETARSFLLSQLLIQYANTKLGLVESGQKCLLYNAPHAPHRQKKLNEIVPDGFYRHLFMSPCLSGWDRGEEKHQYMSLCHRTLSHSQLNTISKLKDAGIITNNLVVLPNTSNTCLANNGTHVSLGSRLLSTLAADPQSGFNPGVEKYMGDLTIKIVEHFLPLFVSTYTAAPYRLDFADFHPEKVLGFLPHELDYTHLRMLWRRWRKKARLRFLGYSFTPFGPHWLDQLLARTLRLHGDLVPDFRLIDYLVTLLSTESCPALNGQPGNQLRLKQELTELGIFDQRMSIYLPYRQREFSTMGYSGFEGRSYSLFPSLLDDIAGAIDMQNLITALAYRLIIEERVHHNDIPDQPSVESERRQIFFAAAIGIPTFFVKANTTNRFLRKILSHVKTQRHSGRYKGYIRVKVHEYQLALLEIIENEGRDLIEELGMSATIEDLRRRLTDQGASARDRVIKGVMAESHSRAKPEKTSADCFNSATERYYRSTLKRQQTREGLQVLAEDCRFLEILGDPHLRQIMTGIDRGRSAAALVREETEAILDETVSPELLQQLIQLSLAVIHHEQQEQP